MKTDKEKVWEPGRIISADYKSRSYTLDTDRGQFVRNRRHLRPFYGDCPDFSQSSNSWQSEYTEENSTTESSNSLPQSTQEPITPRTPNSHTQEGYRTRSGRLVKPPSHLKDFQR